MMRSFPASLCFYQRVGCLVEGFAQGRSKRLGWSDFGQTNICARGNHAHRLFSYVHGIGNESREPLTFVCRSACTQCCKISNVVFTFVLTDYCLADKSDSKDRSMTVFADEATLCDYLVVGLSTATFIALVLSSVLSLSLLQIVWDNCRAKKCLTNVLTTGYIGEGLGRALFLFF